MLHKKIGKYMIPMALGALFTTGAYTFTVYADEVDSVSVQTEVSEYHSESDATEAVNANTTLDNTSSMVVSETNQSLTGWQQNKYLINGEPVNGFQSLDGSNFFFDADGNRMSGIIDGKFFGEDGKQQYGLVHLTSQDGTIQTYFYDVSGNKQTGWQTIDQNTYYFDPSTGASYIGLHQIGNDNYYFESNGTLLKNATGKIVNNLRFNTNNNGRITFTELVNRPTYYNQADRRWAFNYVAGVPFWQIGCVPSVATSVITYLEGNVIQSPYQVGQQFVNWGTMGYFGSTEMSWFKLAEKYHWNIKNHLNLNQIKNALLQGQLVTTAVRYDGRYCQVPGGTHQLLLMGYDEATGKTYVYDPYHGSGSFTGEGGNLCGWYSLQHIWNYQSSIAIDTYGGGPFYAISKNKNIFLLNDIKDISQGQIHIGDQIYTGQTIAPMHGVVLGNTQLTEGIDYVISYQNNKTIGNALAMVTGIGKYAGVLHGNFHILNEKDTFGSNYKNGNYTIQVSANESKVVDIASGSTQEGSKVQIYSSNGTEAQGFYIEKQANGYYTIKNVKSGRYLTAPTGYTTVRNGTKVYQRLNCSELAKLWMIRKTNGSYILSSAYDGNYVLDITSAKIADGTVLQLYKGNGTVAQQWQFVPYVTIQEKTERLLANSKTNIENKLIQSGKAYNIVGYGHANYGIETAGGSYANAANVQLYHLNGTEAQGWYVTFDDNGYATFINVKSGKALDVNAASSANCTNIQQYTSNQTKAQKWIITGDAEHGYVLLSALDINKALDLNAAKYTDCSNIQLYQTNGTSAQTWFFVECAPHKSIVKLSTSDVKHWGVDISQFNGSDFDVTPYDFVLIRSNYGTTTDPLLETYVNACIQADIPYGFYCYSYALSVDDAHTEAAYTLALANQYKPTLGIWYDMEDADNYKTNRGVWTKDATLSFCQTFCKDVKSMGWYTGIYSSSWFIQNWYNTGLEDYDKWVAQWDANDGQYHSDTHTLGSIHQYTSVDDKYPNGLDKNAMYVDFDYYTLV